MAAKNSSAADQNTGQIAVRDAAPANCSTSIAASRSMAARTETALAVRSVKGMRRRYGRTSPGDLEKWDT
jgi:hypothetical protein